MTTENIPAQASDEPMPFPPMPLPIVKHAVVGELFDRLAMQMYALRYAHLVAAAKVIPAAGALDDDEDAEFELIQDDTLVAGTSGKGAWAEMQHYINQYLQDGPVTVYSVTRRQVAAISAQQGPEGK